MLGSGRRLAVLEAMFLDHQRVCDQRGAETTRKIDKVEDSLGKLEDSLTKMHSENQKWIRGVAYGIIILLITMLSALAKAHFHL